MMRNFAVEMIEREPGPHWVLRWLAANSKELKTSYLTPINGARKRAESVFYYKLYFESLERKITEYYILSENQYNINEKGFLINTLIKARRIFSRRVYKADRVNYII